MTVLEFLSIPAISALISLFFKSQNDKKLETLRSELKLDVLKQSKLHNDRADVIAEMYAMLKEVHLNAQRYMKPFEFAGEESKETYLLNANKAWNKFVDYYPKKIIFLPKSAADKLEKVSAELFAALESYKTINFTSPYGVDQRQVRIDNILQKVPTMLDTLEDDFRKLLGDE